MWIQRLRILQILELLEPFRVPFVKMKVPKPSGLTLQHQLGRPHVCQVRALRPGKAVYVSSVVSDVNEKPKICFNQLSFIGCPDWMKERFD